jgi:hypothetical protein
LEELRSLSAATGALAPALGGLFETSPGDANGLFGRIARRFDLSVVKQQERDRPNGTTSSSKPRCSNPAAPLSSCPIPEGAP